MQKNLLNYFCKGPSRNTDKKTDKTKVQQLVDISISEKEEKTIGTDVYQLVGRVTSEDVVNELTSEQNEFSPGTDYPNDIKHFINDKNINNVQRLECLKKLWMPEPSFSFPQSGPRNLRFQYKWLTKFPWLVYSKLDDGAYCKYCALFFSCCRASKEVGRGLHQSLGQFTVAPFKNWKKGIEKFVDHENCKYHRNCVECALTLQNMRPEDAIELKINKEAKRQVLENRKKLIPVIETIILCGRQGLALRGHRDSGPVTLIEPTENDGNFRALLRYRAQTDNYLRENLFSSKANAMYTSWRIQNEIINSCNTLILNCLVKKINENKFFTLLADETTDISTISQLNLCVRLVNTDLCSIEELFLQFVPVQDVSGKGLAETIIRELQAFGIDLKKLRGQGYDGASSMCGKIKGVSARIEQLYPMALYVHCAAHCLNLAVASSCDLASVRNCLGTVNTLYEFFHKPKRMNILKKSIEEICPDGHHEKLKRYCTTRWVEQYNCVAAVVELHPAIVDALEEISDWQDKEASSSANQLLSAVKQTLFTVALFSLDKVFSFTSFLCKLLQERNIDLKKAICLTEDTIEELKELRKNADNTFKSIFQKTKELSDKLEFSLMPPRRSTKQTQRCNVQTNNSEEYYRICIYVPLLDEFICALNDRFMKHKNVLSAFQSLCPSKPTEPPPEEEVNNFKALIKFYKNDLNGTENEVLAELNMWYRLISRRKKTEWPTDAISGLKLCKQDDFLKNIKTLLHILATLPVSTCECERSFSTLRRIKTYLRSNATEERLNGLAMLNIHRQYTPSAEDVLNVIAQKPRRLEITL